MKSMPWREGEGWAHKIQPLQKGLFVSCVQGGMKASMEGSHRQKHLPSLSHGKTSTDREFGRRNGKEAPV